MSMCWRWNPWYRWWNCRGTSSCVIETTTGRRESSTQHSSNCCSGCTQADTQATMDINSPFYLELLVHEQLWCMDSKFQWGVKRKDSGIMRMLVLVCVLGYRWWQVKQVAESWCHQQTWMYGRCWKLFPELSSIFYRFCAYYCWPTSSSTELLLTC